MAPLYFALGLGYASVRWWKFFTRDQWHLEMPGIIDGSISIMSRTGLGIGMFNMGLFIGLQDKLVVCGPGLTSLGMAMRFVAAPAATMIGALLLGLRGDLLRVAILQAALPQSIGTFIFAREYDLHANILSTASFIQLRYSILDLVYDFDWANDLSWGEMIAEEVEHMIIRWNIQRLICVPKCWVTS
ncbi:Putative auxin efflux carrier component 8 [Triticum urartu]|uniref:Putative auxin efflux carrier component 8 n=1 Tax=Triticum urartu TaxID=4572 RepID=M7YI61_TRIUA|nr:Putative auxin efflux carrier component 8 [Triticum urartu]